MLSSQQLPGGGPSFQIEFRPFHNWVWRSKQFCERNDKNKGGGVVCRQKADYFKTLCSQVDQSCYQYKVRLYVLDIGTIYRAENNAHLLKGNGQPTRIYWRENCWKAIGRLERETKLARHHHMRAFCVIINIDINVMQRQHTNCTFIYIHRTHLQSE